MDFELFLRAGASIVYEASPSRLAMDQGIRPVAPGQRLCGPALTVQCGPGDNLAIHRAVAAAGKGEVIVVATGAPAFGYWGEVITVAALARGVAGLVIDGGVRDAAAIRERGFAAWSRGIAIHGTAKVEAGRLRVPIVCGGVPVHDGDLVVADDDGVAIVPTAEVGATVDRTRERIEKEADYMRRLKSGELTLDLLKLRQVLAAHGIED